MTEHSRIGGSKAAQWMNCPGSVIAQSRYERECPSESSEFAEEGTRAHQVAELIVRGWEPPADEDKDMVRFGRQYAAGLRVLNYDYPGVGFTEGRIAAPGISKEMFGTIDYGLRSIVKRAAVLVDYKYGAGEYVSVKENYQLLQYDLMFTETFGYFENSLLAIFQPRGPNPGWRFWSPSSEVREAFRVKTLKAVSQVESGSVETNAGTWCRWCTAKTVCKAYAEAHLEPVMKAGEIRRMTAQEISDIYASKASITQWMSGAERYIKSACKLSEDGEFHGWVLRPKLGKTEWRNAVDIEVSYPREQYPTFYKNTLKTPKQVIELHPEFKTLLEYSYTQSEYQNLVQSGDAFLVAE